MNNDEINDNKLKPRSFSSNQIKKNDNKYKKIFNFNNILINLAYHYHFY
jgi:hypothetical protein